MTLVRTDNAKQPKRPYTAITAFLWLLAVDAQRVRNHARKFSSVPRNILPDHQSLVQET